MLVQQGDILTNMDIHSVEVESLRPLKTMKRQYNNAEEIFWATGACLLVRSEAYWKVGGSMNGSLLITKRLIWHGDCIRLVVKSIVFLRAKYII